MDEMSEEDLNMLLDVIHYGLCYMARNGDERLDEADNIFDKVYNIGVKKFGWESLEEEE